MKFASVLAFAAALAIPGLSQNIPAPEALMHTQTSFNLTVHAPYGQTAPLFSPEGERAWAGKHWDPQFIYPPVAHDEQGAVFTVKHGPFRAVWVTTLFDTEGRHYQYVYFIPEIMVTTIDVHFTVINAGTTRVHVTYARTAVTPEGNDHVTAMTAEDRQSGKEWQAAIDAYLASPAGTH
jgi:hypothetical protein